MKEFTLIHASTGTIHIRDREEENGLECGASVHEVEEEVVSITPADLFEEIGTELCHNCYVGVVS
jgi:hypothetical protein